MAEMDQGIKRLLQTHPQDVLSYTLPGAQYLDTIPVDIATEPQLVLDTLFRVRYKGIECAIDVEAEAQPRAGIARRLYQYGSRASTVIGLSVISVVLWLESGGMPPKPPYEEHVADLHIVTWNFHGFEVYNTPARALLERGLPGLLPLVAFTPEGKTLATIEETAALVKETAPAGDLQELEALLAVFAARTFGTDPILAMMRRIFMNTEILETSPLYQQWISKGREEGRTEGAREAALAVLRGRFGALPEDFERALAAAAGARLDAMLAHAATESLEELRARLAAS
ncbi:MAG: hypothetical protein ACRDHP_17195 [Ktedonobacterales bacterium]